MLIDGGSLSENDIVDADICIVGGGAAGITIALELMGTPFKVVLLESGLIGFDERMQSLYAGPNIGFPAWDLDAARLRMLGGSTNHWAGNCMPLDPIDFEARDGIPHSGWPITRSDLNPHYLRAQKLVETPDADLYDTDARKEKVDADEVPFDPDRLRTFLYAESPPTAFGSAYEDSLRAAGNVTVFLNATALEIETNGTASEVTGILASGIDGPAFRVEAKHYVLAAGGIEVPRLLLLSNNVASNGLGNDNDLVGRFFMDHLSLRPPVTAMIPGGEESLRFYTESHLVDDGVFRGAIGASDKILREEQLPSFLFFVFTTDEKSPGQRSAQRLRRTLPRGEVPETLLLHIENVLTDLDGVTNEIYRAFSGDRSGLIHRDWIEPWIMCESIPNPDSRVTLIEERDEIFGQNRVQLDWQLTAEDRRAFRRATEILAMELGRIGYGRMWSELMRDGSQWPQSVYQAVHHGKHHCGTTRMSAEPRTGVVDADCRVHGISNLHVASSSVFPTHGAGTPTLTIVALAIRLADHLADVMRRGDQ